MSDITHPQWFAAARMAHVPLEPIVRSPIAEPWTPPPPRRLGLFSAPTHVIVIDAAGPHGYGLLASHSADKLRALDAWLDSRDAANEDADGRLPHIARVVVSLPVRRRYVTWTQDAIVDCIQAWHREWGRPPTKQEWDEPGVAEWPSSPTVRKHFVTWNAAIEAAGLQPIARSLNRSHQQVAA